ncbi:hypothetical protein FQN54_007703 [Arachnomyces sp. PD_36]|nr:hypothetical protein FQN54_007703 [Arachnomyces sp. PD_36]
MEPSMVTQLNSQAGESAHLSDAQSSSSASEVNSTLFPAYSTRGTVGSDNHLTGADQVDVKVENDDDQSCFNYIRGLVLVIEIDQKGKLIYEHIPLDRLPKSATGKFHCIECSLYFGSKTQLLVHLLKSGRDLSERNCAHIVCPVCFMEFIGTERLYQLEEHVIRNHRWELESVMRRRNIPDLGQTPFQFERESEDTGDQDFKGVRLDQDYREERAAA